MLIWWTSELDCKTIQCLFQQEEPRDDASPATWPDYLTVEYRSRYGRTGRGGLWVHVRFGGDVSVTEAFERLKNGNMTEMLIGHRLGLWYGGIVIDDNDLHHVACLPGFVTNLELRPLAIEVDQ